MSVRRVLRGGSCYYVTWGLRTFDRSWRVPERRYRIVGFRIVVQRGKR